MMKSYRHILIPLAFTAVLSCTPEGYKEITDPDPAPVIDDSEDDDPSADIVTATFDYGRIREMGHPRLLMTEDDFSVLKAEIAKGSNRMLCKTNDYTLNLAREYLEDGQKVEYVLDVSGERLLGQSRLALKKIWAYSYAYKVTSDRKFLAAALADLTTVCSFPDWHPSHYLDVAEMALGVSIAYDWLYYDIPDALRLKVRKALHDFALMTYPAQNYFHGRNNNWNSVCVGALTATAIVLYEKYKQLCVTSIEEGISANRDALDVIYGSDGSYPEGYSYWNYGTCYEMLLAQMLIRIFGNCAGLDEQEGFRKTAEYMLFMLGPDDKPFSYSDGGSSSRARLIPMWWFAAKYDNPSLVLNEMEYFNTGDYGDSRYMPFIPCILKDFDPLKRKAAYPDKEIWHGGKNIPVVMVHTGWNWNEGDYYLGIKGGYASYSHGHMDAGSFQYVADGERWSKDFIEPDYSEMDVQLAPYGGRFFDMSQSSLRWDITKMNNIVHSTISCRNSDGSVPGKLHVTDHRVDGSALLEEVYETPERLGAKLNMTAPLSDAVAEAHRTVVLVNRRDLEITDRIKAKSTMDANVEWRMLTLASGTIQPGSIMLKRHGKVMYLKAQTTDGNPVKYNIWPSTRSTDWADRPWDEKTTEEVVGFTYTVPAGTEVTFRTVLTQTPQ